ncbi:fumarylacetoacetate hydrolase family protein [Leucobacter sp. gxy201]|uniref:2-keto-4-pentenoate hydratase n=1 Tax=Leucobacter sp. gxy201 TaxID=2957200 RepID=UPI003DA0DBC2
MALTEQQREELAAALRRAETTGEPIEQPSAASPGIAGSGPGSGLELDDAYRVQQLGIARRVARGERVVGRKVGLTSLAMQRQLGVDSPDFGVVTDAMVLDVAGALPLRELISPKLEPEFAFRIDRALPASPTVDEVRDAIGAVALSIEIIDSRVRDWRIGLVDTVADNASSARIVVGAWREASPELLRQLLETEIVMTRDGERVASGPGSAVLGDPVVALHWLAEAVGRYGQAFAPGEVVLAGAVTGAVAVTTADIGSIWRAEAAGFAPVSLGIAA